MSPQAASVFVTGALDDLRSRGIRFLEEASRLGPLTVGLWPDALVTAQTGRPPKFPLAERRYFLEAVRYVSRVVCLGETEDPDRLPSLPEGPPRWWIDEETSANPVREQQARQHGVEYQVLPASRMDGFPEPPPTPSPPGRKKAVVTGCYDWFHTGHVRFCEEASAHGDLYAILGHDKNLRLLKGEGHPLFPQEERRYVVGSIKYVKQALISTGEGWLDADPEIRRLQPDYYVVNEDGDKGGKREYCAQRGIEYIVLQRTPAPGLPRRTSTNLRGF